MARSDQAADLQSDRLTRRALIAGGSVTLGGALGIAWSNTAQRLAEERARSSEPTPPLPSPESRRPVAAASPPPQAASPPPQAALSLADASVAHLRRELDGRRLSAQELIEASIARVEAMDGGEYGLHAVIQLNPDALDIARVRDEELARGASRGPLHGIPVLVKDLFATADAMPTAAGSIALLENAAVRDAFVITRLRNAGAILLGKTNLTEWSKFQAPNQTSGWSARGGQTRNPYRLDMSPWGSSSGSAVAVSAGYAPLAIGVETDGSIVCPAAASAVVGLKPTVGLASRAGVIPISFSLDSPGPMARTVEDLAYLLTAIAGYDAEDPSFSDVGWTSPAAAFETNPVHQPGAVDYTRALKPDGLRGARIGVARNLFFDPAASAIVDDVLPVLAAAGATLVDPANIATASELAPGITEYDVTLTEFPYALNHYLSVYTPNGPLHSLADIVTYNEAHAAEWTYAFNQENFYSALQTGTVWDSYYQATVRHNHALARTQGLDAVMDQYDLDALLAPTTSAPTLISPGGDNFSGACSQISALAGYPILSMPVGYVDGLPVGMSIMGRAFSEATLITLAYAFERVHPVRYPPEFRAGTLA